MKQGYKDILDEFIITRDLTDQIDGRQLLEYLKERRVINLQEYHKMYETGPTTSLSYLVTTVLKTRTDNAMPHFLGAMNVANYTEAYNWLKTKIDECDKNPIKEVPKIDKSQENFVKLLNVFQSNSLIDPESYVSELVIGLILTPEDAELIRRCPTSKNRQEKMALQLATKDHETLKKLKRYAKENRHVDFYQALEKEGF